MISVFCVNFIFCGVFLAARFANNSTKMLFTEFLSVLSAYRIQQPDSVWFHCSRLPDVNDFHWRQLWKVVPLTVLYHDPQTGQHGLKNGLKSARNYAVVAMLLKHGGMFIDWNILVMRSLNPLRNYSTCFSKVRSSSTIINNSFSLMVTTTVSENVFL